MDRLLAMHDQHTQENVPADVAAAWLHHRFTLIHPFTDGNGRVARCLATLVLLQARWLPPVVTRDDRAAYIAALRQADAGDLWGMVEFFAFLQRRQLRAARSLSDEVAKEATGIDGVLAFAKEKIDRQIERARIREKSGLSRIGELQAVARQRLLEVCARVAAVLAHARGEQPPYTEEALRGSELAQFFQSRAFQAAKELGYFADVQRFHAWNSLVIAGVPRTRILFTFHGIGREFAGVLGCAGLLFTSSSEAEEQATGAITLLADEPFEFAYAEEQAVVLGRFREWLELSITKGLDIWQRSL
jgi:hypothetical protein